MYSAVHVVTVDGYSRKVVGTIPQKNAITIFGTTFQPLLLMYLEPGQVDRGTEISLIATV